MKIKTSNEVKSEQLEMSYGKANNILKKNIIFHLVKKCGLDKCYQCGQTIDSVEDISIEHKTPWLHSEDPIKLFFDIENIAFSHIVCNVKARRISKTSHIEKEIDPLSYAKKRIGKSGYKGVTLVNKNKYKYQSFIKVNGKNIHIKYGNDPLELAKLYDQKAIELLGEDAITNEKLGLLKTS